MNQQSENIKLEMMLPAQLKPTKDGREEGEERETERQRGRKRGEKERGAQ